MSAHAPYNFIPLPERIVEAEDRPDHDRYYADRHTGHLEVKLTTETPLYIRGMLTEVEADQRDQHKNKPDFFQLDGKPIIPGSSLRGMLRTLVEIITYSKLQPVTNKRLIYRAVGDTTSYGITYREQLLGISQNGVLNYPSRNVHGGYLVRKGNNDWAIQPAKRFNNESFVFVTVDAVKAAGIRDTAQTTQTVWVSPGLNRTNIQVQKNAYIRLAPTNRISGTQQPGLERGSLIVSGKAPNRTRYPVIFEPDLTATLIPIPNDEPNKIWELYETDRDLNRGIATRPLRNHDDPLFYLLDNNGRLIFFGPTMMFRLPPPYTIHDMIPAAIKPESLLDMVEVMFGIVTREESTAPLQIASRISVTDARLTSTKPDIFEATFVPKILSTPKPTTFQHYLEQPDGAMRGEKHYGHVDSRVRGHKLYWRQRAIEVASVREMGVTTANDTQHTRMRPVKPGVTFTFRVHFENLTDVELGALLWAVRLPASAEHRHQLGMGKPYGMGVVKLEPKLKLPERNGQRYRALFNNSGWEAGEIDADEWTDEFIERFRIYLMSKLGVPADTAFTALERIQELCVMLTPQTPRGDTFKYMQIEGPQNNEYTDRPVLPHPSKVSEVVGKLGLPIVEVPPAPPAWEPPLGTVFVGRIVAKDGKGMLSVKLPKEYDEHIIDVGPDNTRGINQDIRLEKIEGGYRIVPSDKKRK